MNSSKSFFFKVYQYMRYFLLINLSLINNLISSIAY